MELWDTFLAEVKTEMRVRSISSERYLRVLREFLWNMEPQLQQRQGVFLTPVARQRVAGAIGDAFFLLVAVLFGEGIPVEEAITDELRRMVAYREAGYPRPTRPSEKGDKKRHS